MFPKRGAGQARGHPPSSIRCSFFPSCFEAAGFAIYSPKWTATEVPLCPSWFLSTFIFCRICWTSFRMRSGRMSVLIQYKSDPLAQAWVTVGHPGKATKQVDIMSCPLQYFHIAVPSLSWYDTETDDQQREPMFNIWFTCYFSSSDNSSFFLQRKLI